MPHKNILLLGGAGLVGQNLVIQLKKLGIYNITVLDKHQYNLQLLKQQHPDIIVEYADLAELCDWEKFFINIDVVVMLQAQIGASTSDPFIRNNIQSTHLTLQLIQKYNIPYLIHISSSVVMSVANDDYTNTKKEQEKLVLESGIPCTILRPTLMFGWFDRKHLGWLSRFMQKTPIFPIPGHGNYIRQPLYVTDFCNIITSCIAQKPQKQIYNITGLEKITYIEIIKSIKSAIRSRSIIINIPYMLFFVLIKIWGLFDKNPPFTTEQLTALIADDIFETIDWPTIFNITPTPFTRAINTTFNDKIYSRIILKF